MVWYSPKTDCGCKTCCPPLQCFGGKGSIEWVDIGPGTNPIVCDSGGPVECVSIGRLFGTAAEEVTSFPVIPGLNETQWEGSTPCIKKWVVSNTETAVCTLNTRWCSFNFPTWLVTFKRTKVEVLYWLRGTYIADIVINEHYEIISAAAGSGLIAGDELVFSTSYRRTEVDPFSGIYTFTQLSTSKGVIGAARCTTGPRDMACTWPQTIEVKFCQRPPCTSPACRCWDETENALVPVPNTAFLTVCGGTVIPAGLPGYTGCSNGAYFLACGTTPGVDPVPCWELTANCNVPFGSVFSCTVANIIYGGFLLSLVYRSDGVQFRLISHTRTSALTVPRTFVACEIVGQAVPEFLTLPACPFPTMAKCGLGALNYTINYFTFPLGNINARTPLSYSDFTTLATSNDGTPICDYTTATPSLTLI